MPPPPLILSPALPTELLTSIIQHETYPTTLIICATRAEFLTLLKDDIQNPAKIPRTQPDDPEAPPPPATTLLAAPLYQVAVARHIRMAFVPTVSHLRAYLSAFSPADSRVPPPPSLGEPGAARKKQPLLVAYGFLGLHRDTSEWSAQGIGATAAALVEAGRRCGFRVVVADAPRAAAGDERAVGVVEGEIEGEGAGAEDVSQESILAEEVPVLSASVVRAGGDVDDAAWTSRKVTLSRVLGRWFRYKEGGWVGGAKENT